MQDETVQPSPDECGNHPNPPDQEQPQQLHTNNQPMYYPVYIERPKTPGKGLGIASMILGIFAIIYSSMLSMMALLATGMSFAIHSNGSVDVYKNMKIIMLSFFDSDDIENLIALIFTSFLCTVLAFVFTRVSRNKGYRNKISKSGLILSTVSFALIFVFIGFIGYAYYN